MDSISLFRRQPFVFEGHVLDDPDNGLVVARTLWAKKKFLVAMDLYDVLSQIHCNHAVQILAEAYDKLKELTSQTRYNLYQSRFFDFPIKPTDKVLDIGSGLLSFPLATHFADISLNDASIGRLGIPFKHVDGKPAYEVRVEETGFEDKQFDFVYCSHVLEHSDDPAAACRELARIGKRGYIETPTKGKDVFLGGARDSNHRWHVELVSGGLIFTEYEEHDLSGFGINLLLDMHVAPQSDREKAFSALLYLRADQCNTMMGWEGSIECEVRSTKSIVQVKKSPSVEINEYDNLDSPCLRLVQVHTFYVTYLEQFYAKHPELIMADYETQIRALVDDGFSGIHIIAPHMGPLGYDAKFIIANNPYSQAAWAREHGLDERLDMRKILQIQINSFQPQVLYLSDPIGFDSNFIRSLNYRPKCVLGWRAADIPSSWDPSEFDVILSSLSGIRQKAISMGARSAEHFHPGFPFFLLDNVNNNEPDVDVVFCGQVNKVQYDRRNRKLNALAKASKEGLCNCQLYLSGDLTAVSPDVQDLNCGPMYGLDMYRAVRRGRIAFDARGEIGIVNHGKRVDLAVDQTANMRIFEATGLGAFLLTEHFSNVEDFFIPGKEIETYSNEKEMFDKIRYYCKHPDKRIQIAKRGQQRCLRDHSMEQATIKLDSIIRRKLSLKKMVTSPEKIKLDYKKEVALLASRVKELIDIEVAPEILDSIVNEIMTMLIHLIEKQQWDQAMILAAVAKTLPLNVRNLDFLRAFIFYNQGLLNKAQKSLDEEIKKFPDNSQAQRFLLVLQTSS